MPISRAWLSWVILACLVQPILAQDTGWVWISGQLSDPKLQREYEQSVQRIFDYYQSRKTCVGTLVAEADLEAVPGRAVFLGPVQAFRHPEWFGAAIAIEDGTARLGGVTLANARTGIFLRNRDQTRVLYTGLSPGGFGDIFKVQTGSHACTVTIDGTVRHTGDWVGDRIELRSQSFLPVMPTNEALSAHGRPVDSAVTEPVYAEPDTDELSPEFVKTLDRLVRDQKVLFVGESHWNTGVNDLFNRLLRHVLREHNVQSVFLELNYSFSAFYDHYVSLDDTAAAQFFRTTLSPLVNYGSTLETLDIVRTWNLAHPEQRVRVACLDMEWDMKLVVDEILAPYLGGDVTAPPIESGKRGWQALLAELEKQLEKTAAAPPDHPVLTHAYVARVVENLRDTLAIERLHEQRQPAIVRNVTEFHGELLGESLAVFKGGGYHAVKSPGDGTPYHRDAEHLHHHYPGTKGRVATLQIQGIGHGFADVATIDLDQHMRSADNYKKFVQQFQNGLRDGTANVDAFYLLNGDLDPTQELAVRSASRDGHTVVRLTDAARRMRAMLSRKSSYDEVVYVVRAQLEATRRRPNSR